MKYHKFPIISPGLMFCSKGFFAGLIFGDRSLFSEELNIGRNFAFQNGLGLTIKTAENTTKIT